ncbi:AAA family ATPase [Amycolatopsis sp. NPDC004378]
MLIERDAELAVLADLLEAGGRGAGSLAVIGGRLGCGRSALLHATAGLAADRGTRVLRASAAPTERQFPHGVARQLLEPLVAEGRDLPAELSLVSPPGAAELEAGRHALLHRLWVLVAEVAADRPVALLVDDLQWADAESLGWLAHLVNRLRAMPLVVVASVLDGDAGADRPVVGDLVRAAAAVLQPGPLTREGTRAFLERHCGEPAGERLAAACREVTGGSPMLLAALADAMLADDLGPGDGQLAEVLALRPTGPSHHIARCLRAQPPRVAELARAMTSFGDARDTAALGRLSGLDPADLEEATGALRRLGLLASDGVRFAGVRIAEAVAGTMTVPEQDELRLRAAEVLYTDGAPLERIARELLATTAEPAPWGTEVLRGAAAAAADRGEAEQAAQYLRHALLYTASERGVLLADLVAAERGRDPGATTRHLQQALPLLPTPAERADLLCRVPALATARSREETDLLRGTLVELTANGGEDDLRARLEARLWLYGQDNASTFTAAADRLRRLGPDPAPAGPGQRELVVALLHAATQAEAVPRRAAAEFAHRVLDREPGGPAQMYTVLPLVTAVLVAADATEGLESWLSAAAEPGPGEPGLAALLAWVNQAKLWAATGGPVRARDRALEALGHAAPDWSAVVTDCVVLLARLAIELGDDELALRARQAAGSARLAPWELSMVHGAVAVTAGDLPTALEYVEDYGRQVSRAGRTNPAWYPWRLLAASLHGRAGRRAPAAELVEQEYEHARRWGAPAAVGRALRARAALVAGAAGVRLLHESVAALATSGNRLELAKSLIALGRRPGVPDAEDHLRRGRRLRLLCDLPEPAPGEGVSPRTFAGDPALTTTEQRIVELVARGGRNRDIAAELGVTIRAVEKHLTSAYRKLRIKGRAELVMGTASAPEHHDLADPRAG